MQSSKKSLKIPKKNPIKKTATQGYAVPAPLVAL
jgi:hypothetical protein